MANLEQGVQQRIEEMEIARKLMLLQALQAGIITTEKYNALMACGVSHE